MAKRKVSERDLLIEQCLHDAYCEREGIINEGFIDNLKANARAAGEWLKQDAKDSFRLRKKGDVQANRKNAAASGKIKSYAGSLAKTMSDFKKSGGTLGRNINNIDDVINRLNLVSKGKSLHKVIGNNGNEQGQPIKKSSIFNNPSITDINNTAIQPSNQLPASKETINNNSDNNSQEPTTNNISKPLSKRDIDRKKRQENIFKNKEKEAEKAKIERAKRIKNLKDAANKKPSILSKGLKAAGRGINNMGKAAISGIDKAAKSLSKNGKEFLSNTSKGINKATSNITKNIKNTFDGLKNKFKDRKSNTSKSPKNETLINLGPSANLRSNIPANAKKGLKLKTSPTSKKRRRILTAKNALDTERSQKAMQKLVDSNPDMFMFDSYIPQHNTNAQLSMLNSII